MEILDYHTKGGKNVILEYISALPIKTKTLALDIRKKIEEDGLEAFTILTTRQLKGKLYEIKFSNQRIMYVIRDEDAVYFLHICKKQSQKTERKHLQLAIKRAKEAGYNI